MRRSLLDAVGGLIRRTYRIRSGLVDLGPFVIGDRGYRRLYATRGSQRVVAAFNGHGAKTLVRETEQGIAACIYFPDAMIRCLEAHPPQRGLHAENLAAFATFVEEIDHLLVIAERSLGRRPVSLFELELHANVSKYLVAARFLAGTSGRLSPARRLWLRHHLFDAVRYTDEDPLLRRRYHEAAHWAVRLLNGLSESDPAPSVDTLRRFHTAPLAAKLRLIEGLAKS